MNKINLNFKGYINGNYLLCIELIKSGKYGEYLDNIDYLFEGTREDNLVYHPYKNDIRLSDINSINVSVNSLEYEDKDSILYVREHIRVHYYNSVLKSYESVVIYDKEDIDNFLNSSYSKSGSITLNFKDKPYKTLRVYTYINHMQYIEGITIPTVSNRVDITTINDMLRTEEIEEDTNIEDITPVHIDEVVYKDVNIFKKIGYWVRELFGKNKNVSNWKPNNITTSHIKSPDFYSGESTFMSYIEDEISNYSEDDIGDDNISYRNDNKVRLKGKLIIDELLFRIDLTRDEINLLNGIK